MILWFTGQPGAGKTTLCQRFLSKVKSPFDSIKKYGEFFHIDGDDLRDLFDNKDYSENGRRKNIEVAQQIAQYLHNKGQNVLVSLVSPYKDQRDKFKQKMGDKLIEIYVHTTEFRGREDFFVKNYEKPIEDFIDIDTTNVPVEVCVDLILEYVKL